MAASPIITALIAGALAPCAVASVIRDDRTDADARSIAGTPAFATSARLTIAGGVGSATLIATDWLLTAAHVVTSSAGTPVAPGTISVLINGENRSASSVIAHPSWTGGNYTAGVDLALVHLTVPMSTVTGTPLYTGSSPVGRQVTLLGYGAFGHGSSGLTDPPGTLRGATNTLDATASTLYPTWSPSLLLMDFDAPGTTLYNRSGSTLATDAEGSPATGDSGGGSFILEGGVWQLAGVHSFTFTTSAGAAAPFGYGTGSADVSVADFAPWISSVIPAPGTAAALALGIVAAGRRRRK